MEADGGAIREAAVFIMVRYPPAVGALTERDLDNLFLAIRTVRIKFPPKIIYPANCNASTSYK